ncbi:unnamed protein product [Mesocestoides corti]|uniref:Ig-like domain-containing protein n=1 Tax=Mesocestoides corti TaxID=53468 RepID=A0A0R3UFC6_MESCO|nr:unnamed protein product [Mesocestoides corti]
MVNFVLSSALILAVCQVVQGASNCIELLSENSFALFCPSYSGSLPPEIPSGKQYSKLQIESANFPYGGSVLSKENFTGLEGLTYLRITSSGIDRITPDAFFNLKHLNHLDLSRNRLTFIEPGTFRGLKLKKLILSGNLGLQLPSAALSGAKIFNFVAKDCAIHSISYSLFKQTGTRHISLVNNRIRTLSDEFSSLILPSDGSWGSIDLSNNSLVCDCALLWLAQLIDRQRRYMDETSEPSGSGPFRYPRQVDEPELFKPMYQLNLTCSAPKHLVHHRFPLPSEFDCPPPQITGIDIVILGKNMETVQLTCHARGRPTPNVAWAFKQHDQEVHRIVKSPKKLTPWNRDQLSGVYIGLNVSLREFQARDFSCITWSDSGLSRPTQVPNSQDNWLSVSTGSASSIVPRGPLSPDKAHRVGIRLSGLKLEDQDKFHGLLTEPSANDSVAAVNGEPPKMNVTLFSPYQQLFVRRFTPLDLIGAIIGTFAATLILLCLVTRCIPQCYHRKSRSTKHALLHYERKQVMVPFSKDEKNDTETVEQNQLRSSQQQSAYFADAATTVGSGSGPGYWPIQDYAYSSHEYDVPGMTDPLAGAMPLSPRPMLGVPNATGTLVRRGRPMSTSSLHPSAVQTPYLFPKAATSTALLLPPVATVPPLGVVASPFLSYVTVPQPPLPTQQPPVYFSHNHHLSLSTLPNGQLFMTPTMTRNANDMTSKQSGEPEGVAGSSTASCNSDRSAGERLLGAPGPPQ